MMKNKASRYLMKYPRILICCFIDQIFSLQVMNGTTNMKTILFSKHKSLDLCFYREKHEKKKFEKRLFVSS